mmetsp:Transcript_14020/g.40887  ORF Transcript_14020/g.40887 Transcript_14020/m.40887 type:complete len:314 (-) Transcript_14020:1282-2223(-)
MRRHDGAGDGARRGALEDPPPGPRRHGVRRCDCCDCLHAARIVGQPPQLVGPDGQRPRRPLEHLPLVRHHHGADHRHVCHIVVPGAARALVCHDADRGCCGLGLRAGRVSPGDSREQCCLQLAPLGNPYPVCRNWQAQLRNCPAKGLRGGRLGALAPLRGRVPALAARAGAGAGRGGRRGAGHGFAGRNWDSGQDIAGVVSAHHHLHWEDIPRDGRDGGGDAGQACDHIQTRQGGALAAAARRRQDFEWHSPGHGRLRHGRCRLPAWGPCGSEAPPRQAPGQRLQEPVGPLQRAAGDETAEAPQHRCHPRCGD